MAILLGAFLFVLGVLLRLRAAQANVADAAPATAPALVEETDDEAIAQRLNALTAEAEERLRAAVVADAHRLIGEIEAGLKEIASPVPTDFIRARAQVLELHEALKATLTTIWRTRHDQPRPHVAYVDTLVAAGELLPSAGERYRRFLSLYARVHSGANLPIGELRDGVAEAQLFLEETEALLDGAAVT